MKIKIVITVIVATFSSCILQAQQIKLISCDGQEFNLDGATAQLSQTLNALISATQSDEPITLTTISGSTLHTIIASLKELKQLKTMGQKLLC